MAAGVVDSMIADKEAAVKKAEKEKPKHADTIAGKIAAEKERKAAIERAKAELEAWKRIAAAKAGHEQAVGERKAAEVKEQEQERHEAAVAQAEQPTKPEKADGQKPVKGEPTETKEERQRTEAKGEKPTEEASETTEEKKSAAEEGEAGEGEPKPVGKGLFGNIYDQFKGKVKEAVEFLLKHKSGDLLGVFHRDEVGDIDLVWGDDNKGLQHIINGHILVKDPDFKNIDEAISRIDDIVKNGKVIKDGEAKIVFEKDGYRVVISKNINGKKKNWVLTSYDSTNGKGKKKERLSDGTTLVTPGANEGSRAVASSDNLSKGKDSASGTNVQEGGGKSVVAVKEKPKDERDGDGKQLTPAPKGGRRRRGGFKGSGPAAKSSEELFAEEKHGRYSGFYKEVLDSSSTIKEAVQKFVGRLRELAAAHKDWSSRKYKSNSGVVAAGSKYGELEAGNRMRIDVVNEKRRENTLRGIEKEAKEIEGYIHTLLERCGISQEDSGQYVSEKDSFESFLRENEKPKKDDDDDGPDRPAGGAGAGGKGKTLLYHRGPVVAEPNEAEQALLEAVNGVLKDTGIEVVTDVDEGQKVLDAANGKDVRTEARHRSEESEERNKIWRLIDRATAMFTGKTEKEAREARRKEMQKITAERKEMYDRVLSGNFDEVTLRQIDNYIDNFSPYNNEWRPISKRLPQKALRGLRKGERASAVDVLFSRISESAVPKNERAGAEGKRRIEEKKKELLKKWAIATGNWHTSVSDFTDAKEPLGSGKDSDVYQSKDGKHVIKVSKGKDGLKKFRPDIDAVTLFNYIFPESRYKILGYGEVDGKFVKFLKQPIVDFTGSKPLSAEERVAYMADMGFKPVNKEKTAFSNGTIVVADLQGNNIVRDKSGNIRVIDADVKLHTKDFGGQYSYPPVEADTALPQANNGGNEKPRMQKVYHGSGADFDEFDNSHMGEGEGAQAYGWGTYVTEVEDIGRHYAQIGFLSAEARRNGNGDPKFLAANKIITQETFYSNTGTYEQRKSAAVEDVKRTIASFEKMLKNQTDEKHLTFLRDSLASYKATLDELMPMTEEQYNEERSRQGRMRHLYTVEIPDDNGENYIDYNGRISDIPSQKIDAICTELEKLGWKRKDLPSMVRLTDGYGNIVLNPNAAGADLYEEIKVALKSQKLASELLSRAGFAGIKYPAEYMSGGRKDGAKNYVIFNEKDARITDHVRFFRTSGGEAYGFTVGGKIYVDPRIATADTPIHEYAHLWGDMMRRVNPKAWGDIVRLMKGKGGLWDWVKKNYSELETDDEVADEVLAQFSGKRGAERLREEMRKTAEGSGSITEKAKAISALQRVKEALGRFWRGVAELLHIRFTTAEEVADRVMADLLHGVDPRKVMDGGKSLRPDTRISVVGASPEHGFKNYAEAKEWAKQNIARTYSSEETGGKGTIRISNAAIGKYLSQSAVDKSDSKDVHLAVLKVLPKVLRESVDAEQHADHLKGEDGVRSAENGTNSDVTIHRLYGAVTIGGKLYRVKVTLKEDLSRSGDPKKAYSYEATKIELLAGQHGKDSETERFPRNSNNSITAANLLRGVEKSYGGGKFFEDYWNPRYSLRHPFGEDRKEERKSEESGSVEEVNQKFNDELDAYADKSLPQGHRFDLGMPSPELESAGFPRLPISMRSSVIGIKSNMTRHMFAPSDLKDLVKAIQKPIAVFSYTKDNMRNMIVDLERGGKHFLVGVTLGYKGNGIEINSVSGLFPKDSHEWIKWIQDGKAVRIDQKEKVLNLIDSLRTNPAESARIGLDLDNTANIVQGFENPKLPEENVSDEGKMFRDSEGEDPDEGMMFRDGNDDDIGDVDLGDAVDKMRKAAKIATPPVCKLKRHRRRNSAVPCGKTGIRTLETQRV